MRPINLKCPPICVAALLGFLMKARFGSIGLAFISMLVFVGAGVEAQQSIKRPGTAATQSNKSVAVKAAGRASGVTTLSAGRGPNAASQPAGENSSAARKPENGPVKCTGANGLTQPEILELLDAHNSVRSKLKLQSLTWDCNLADIAQWWAAAWDCRASPVQRLW